MKIMMFFNGFVRSCERDCCATTMVIHAVAQVISIGIRQ